MLIGRRESNARRERTDPPTKEELYDIERERHRDIRRRMGQEDSDDE